MCKTWKLVQWIQNRATLYQVFTLYIKRQDGTKVFTRTAKAECLAESFFPQVPNTDLEDISHKTYPDPVAFPTIDIKEIQKAIFKFPSQSAPRTDNIPNKILKTGFPVITPCLHWLFNSSLNLGYCLCHFRDSITISPRKPGKLDYHTPNAYPSIALLNTIRKTFDSIIVNRLRWAAEIFELLPRGYMGGNKSTSPEHALHLLLESVYAAWNEKDTATLLLLNVNGAFDNISSLRLLHNLCKRKIGGPILQWISSFLQDRSTTLKLVDFTSSQLSVNNSIPQGSPLSLILYLFYNSDLIDACTNPQEKSIASGFIDDVAILVRETTANSNFKTLYKIHRQTKIWAATHASVFNVAKYQLIHFCPHKFIGPEVPMRLDGKFVPVSCLARYLGIYFDSCLTWKSYLAYLEAKITPKLSILSAIAGST